MAGFRAGIRRRRSRPGAFLKAAILGLLLSGPGILRGHDSPEHVIEHLDRLMGETGVSSGLLCRRAVEYRALGRLEEAASDLARALQLDPGSVAVLTELGDVQFVQGKYQGALATVRQGLDLSGPGASQARLYLLRARIYEAQGQPAAALADLDAAFGESEPGPDWYLFRSDLQARLGRFQERVHGLREGLDRTGSGVLVAEHAEALIDAGQFEAALGRIEPALADSRWRSSWLLRRARARIGLGQETAARADLEAALAEMDRRLHPAAPDPMLLADRGLALALLGQREAAARDLAEAESKGAEKWVVGRLRRALEARAP